MTLSVPVPLPTIVEALASFHRGQVRSSELLARVLSRIDELDGRLNAYSWVDREGAQRAAAAADEIWRRGQAPTLGGIPVSVKDIIDIKGTVTGCGNPVLEREPAHDNATVIERLKMAGAIIVGKTHLHEFGLGITGENSLTGTPRNPYDPQRLPGGSSSGSAVSVASGMALASIGTDTGGSVRVPAALCGLVGFKPTFGRISRAGVFPLAWSMDHVGVMGRTVPDVRLLYNVLAGDDQADPTTFGLPVASLGRQPKRIAVLRQLLEAAAAPVRAGIERTLGRLGAAGLDINVVDMPYQELVGITYTTILLCEAATVHYKQLRKAPEAYGQEMRTMLCAGATLFAADYIQAQRVRSVFAAACDQLLREYDCLISPTTLVPAPLIGQQRVDIDGKSVSTREALVSCTSPFSMIGLPAVSMPIGEVSGLPVGIQVIGPRYEDLLVLDIAQLIQQVSLP